MKTVTLTELANMLHEELFGRVIPCWLTRGVDRDHSGLFTCLNKAGEIFSTDKYLSSQARAQWVYQVVLHSCGAVHAVIERLIAAGVNCLHPIQALAKDMDAATLARDFKGRIAFMGGIDTQQPLTLGTPEQIRADVRRVRSLLGPNLIVSPSHEAILPTLELVQ